MSISATFRRLVQENKPLQIVGAVNAYCATLAKQAGHKALYVSGAGVANASLSAPDLAVTHLGDVVTDVSRMALACDLPILVDVDTGWGNVLTAARAARELQAAGAAAIHVEDQAQNKRCGHRPNKQLADVNDMCDRISSLVEGRGNGDLVVMARTDAIASEGIDAAIARCDAYVAAGAEMIFLEAARSLKDYQTCSNAIDVPILANCTEFGQTPLFTASEFAGAGVSIVLYPLSAFRAMSKAADTVYRAIATDGTQKDVTDLMQTRQELYATLDYHAAEAKFDSRRDQDLPAKESMR